LKVLVLGGAGMLGHKLIQRFVKEGFDTSCTIRNLFIDPFITNIELYKDVRVFGEVDVMDFSGLKSLVTHIKPDFIVNAVGVIKQRDTAKVAVPSIGINSLLPHLLAECAQMWGGKLIHFSTDCVFSGKDGGYTETSISDADDLYGRSKYLGEVATPNALTLRTSIIGRELSHFASLVEWFLTQNGKATKGFSRALYSGLTTNEMAEVVTRIITARPDLSGLWHLTSPTINKYDLLLLIREAYNLEIEIEFDDQFVMDRSMTSERFWTETGWVQPNWPAMIGEMAADPTPYHRWQMQR